MLQISPEQIAQKFPLRVARKTGVACAYCNAVFTPSNKRGPVPLYCSRACQGRAARDAAVQAAVIGATPE